MRWVDMKTLIITEKPKVSRRIAQVLSEKYRRRVEGGVSYYELGEDSNKIYVASAAGHLYSLAQIGEDRGYPVFDIEWAPLSKIDQSKRYVDKYIQLLSRLSKDIDNIVIATDWDIEGELLGYNALRFSCGREDAKRMHFSTLTRGDLINAYENPKEIDKGLVAAGDARHKMDWYWGINTSRALSHAARKVGKNAIISAGRVQTPALSIIVKREKEIAAFKPEKYWEVVADLEYGSEKFEANHIEGRIDEEENVNTILENSRSDRGIVEEVDKKETKIFPPVPFDLGELQTESYRLFGFTPKRTQAIAQSLYEAGLISYPRTSSQKLPPAIGFKAILEKLSRSSKFKPYLVDLLKKASLRPRQGKKTDPAHPAIYPTGVLAKKLTKDEERLYGLVVHRFMAIFGESLLRADVTAMIKIGKEMYKSSGSRITFAGWTEMYPYARIREKSLPELKEDDHINVLKVRPRQKETQPPRRYNPASLIKELEEKNLGTKATRADILDTLYKRNYIVGMLMEATVLGTKVVEALETYVPEIISDKLTRRFEDKIEGIREGREDKDEVLNEAKEELTKIMKEFQENEEKMGEVLKQALEEVYRKQYVVGKCPNCGHDLRIIRAKATKKIFIGCTNYPKCSTSYPLPQRTGIRTTDKICKTCGLPMVSIPFKTRRILSCVDMNCPSKKRRKKKYSKK